MRYLKPFPSAPNKGSLSITISSHKIYVYIYIYIYADFLQDLEEDFYQPENSLAYQLYKDCRPCETSARKTNNESNEANASQMQIDRLDSKKCFFIDRKGRYQIFNN